MKRNLIIALLLAALTLSVFWPATRHDFVNFDDPDYVTANAQVQKGLNGANVIWAFTTGHAANWHPLTWLSHMTDVQLFGMNPSGHHFTSILLHSLSAGLLFLALTQLTGARWRSVFVAGLFALHPLHVESVAWIAERKDVLSGLFFMLTLWSYAAYAQAQPGAWSPQTREVPTRNRRTCYALSLALFSLGLLSKPMLVTLPCLLLLLDYWPLRRLHWPTVDSLGSSEETAGEPAVEVRASTRLLVLEKIPFFLLTILSSVITFIVQREGGAMQSLTNMAFSTRFENAIVSYVRYLGKTFWPASLATPYSHPGDWPLVTVLSASVLLLAITGVCLVCIKRHRFLPVGWFWYVGMLVPVIGLVQVGAQSMADRYTYLPIIGVFIALAWGVEALVASRSLPRLAVSVTASVILLACTVQTTRQLQHWTDTTALFSHAIKADPGNWIAHYNLGHYLDEKGQKDLALTNLFQAVAIKPNCGEAWNNIGFIFGQQQDYSRALPYFEKALASDPDSVEVHRNLGKAYEETGQLDRAVERYQWVLKRVPDDKQTINALANTLAQKGAFPEVVALYERSLAVDVNQHGAHYGLANALMRLRRADEAVLHYQAALKLKPEFAEGHHDLGIALARKGDFSAAAEHLAITCRLQTNNASAALNLGRALTGMQKFEEASVWFERALQLKPDLAEAHAHLGLALIMRGSVQPAVQHLRQAIRLRPGDVVAHFNLGKALAQLGEKDEARAQFKEALRLAPDYGAARSELEKLAP